MTNSETQTREAAPSRSSIVAHPWFPKMIGLWFAALFGLCSLALAPEMLERIVTSLGIDRIIPAAAPPLGQTARLLLAMGMAGVGEITGLLIGARLAAPKRPEPMRRRGLKSAAADVEPGEDAPQLRDRDRHPDAPARKPLSAISDLRENLGENLGGIDNALRRRALASEAEHEPRPFIESAPLPGGEWQPVTVVEPQAAPAVAFVAEQPEAVEVFDLAQFDAPFDEEPEAQPAPFAPFAPFAAPPAPLAPPVPSAMFVQDFTADEPTPASSGPAPAEIATASLDQLGVVQLSERLALALQARRERRLQACVVVLPFALPAATPVEEPDFVEPVVTAPVEELLLPEPLLPQPFVAHEAAFAAAAPTPTSMPAPFAARPLFAPLAADDADEDHEIPALARSLTMPRLGRFALAELEADVTAAPESSTPEFARGLEILARRAPKPFVEYDAPVEDGASRDEMVASNEADEPNDEALEEGYSSLLAMGSGLQRPEAVRIEEPQSDEIEPVVIFPGQGARALGQPANSFGASAGAPFARPGAAPLNAPATPAVAAGEGPASQADSDETDRALRAALASLQRISGAR